MMTLINSPANARPLARQAADEYFDALAAGVSFDAAQKEIDHR